MACQPKDNEHNALNSECLFDFVVANNDDTPSQHANGNDKETNSENRKSDEIFAKFFQNSDPRTFVQYIHSWLPKLRDAACPMSYKHLMLLLLEPPRNLQRVQREMKKWVQSNYSDNVIQMGSPGVLSKTSVTSGSLLRAEIRMLRNLMEPLREDRRKMSIYWRETGEPDAREMRRQLNIAMEIIGGFERDTVTDKLKPSYPGSDNTLSLATREIRLAICKFNFLTIEQSKSRSDSAAIWRFSDEHVSRHSLAPLTPSSPADPRENDLQLILKTAHWLALARGATAVDLFLDVARVFDCNEPFYLSGPNRES